MEKARVAGCGQGWALGTPKFASLRWGLVECLSLRQGDLESREGIQHTNCVHPGGPEEASGACLGAGL